MNLQEFKEKLPQFTGDERAEYIPRVMDMLCDLSRNQLIDFQNKWDGSRSFEAFRSEQDKVIATCVDLEVSDAGRITRKALGLEPITLQTVID